MGRLDGKVALITGGARGQGRSHAVTLAREGARIVVTDICETVSTVVYQMATPADLEETVRLVEELDQRCVAIKADVRSSEQMNAAVERAVSEFGRIDIVVANAGIATAQGWDAVDDEVWEETVETNLTGVWRSIRPAIPHMIKAGGGSIIITSSAAALRGYVSLLPYSAAKAGVYGLMKTLSVELGQHSIRVNTISPGATATPMYHSQVMIDLFVGHENGTLEEMEFPSAATLLLPIPWLEPQDQSNAVLFLASDEARYITGVNLPVDAGTVNQPPGIPPIAAERIAKLSQ
jgi:(+)-trans-carveol dehydrogenase